MRSILLACVLMACAFQKMAIAESTDFAQLPEPFIGMETNNFLKNGMVPIAIYITTESGKGYKVAFTCVGIMYWEEEGVAKAIVPKHMFREASKLDELYGYGVRIARPDSHSIVGFITNVKDLSGNRFGRDVALVSVGINKVSARKLASAISVPTNVCNENIIYSFTNSVVIRGKSVKSLRSFITNKEVKILGYALEVDSSFFKDKELEGKLYHRGLPTDFDKAPQIAIDIASEHGFSGSPFFDEYGRIFIMSSSRLKPEWGAVKGLSLLTGPITLGRE